MYKSTLLSLCLIGILTACNGPIKSQQSHESEPASALQTMQKHLSAVSNKDLDSLAQTLPPNGKMQLILPGEEIKHTVLEFIEFHQSWFETSNWTFETKILNSKVGNQLAVMVVEVFYREPLRDGQPYFNRMIVSYDLEKTDGQWYVIKDHASSVEKSTDQ